MNALLVLDFMLHLLSKIVQSAILFQSWVLLFYIDVSLRNPQEGVHDRKEITLSFLGVDMNISLVHSFGRNYFQRRRKVKHNTRYNRTGIFHKSGYQERTRYSDGKSTRLPSQRCQGNRLHRMNDCLTGVSRLFQ